MHICKRKSHFVTLIFPTTFVQFDEVESGSRAPAIRPWESEFRQYVPVASDPVSPLFLDLYLEVEIAFSRRHLAHWCWVQSMFIEPRNARRMASWLYWGNMCNGVSSGLNSGFSSLREIKFHLPEDVWMVLPEKGHSTVRCIPCPSIICSRQQIRYLYFLDALQVRLWSIRALLFAKTWSIRT